MIAQERADEIGNWLESSRTSWPFLAAELQARCAALIEQLVGTNNDETRGRIKALRDVMKLPETLQYEREGITSGLADNAPES